MNIVRLVGFTLSSVSNGAAENCVLSQMPFFLYGTRQLQQAVPDASQQTKRTNIICSFSIWNNKTSHTCWYSVHITYCVLLCVVYCIIALQADFEIQFLHMLYTIIFFFHLPFFLYCLHTKSALSNKDLNVFTV